MCLARDSLDTLLSFDAMAALDQLHHEKFELLDHKEELAKIENNIKRARKGQNVYLEFKKIGGSILVIGIIIGSKDKILL